MTQSMTAFARLEREFPWGSLVCEMRSVNQRFLEPTFKMPDFMHQYELPLRDRLRKRLSRGKIECLLRVNEVGSEHAIQLDANRLAQVTQALKLIQNQGVALSTVDPLALMQFPGVMHSSALEVEVVSKQCLALFDETLDQLLEGRAREGAELARMIEQRLAAITTIVADLRAHMPEIIAKQRDSLSHKIAQLNVDIEPDRLEQEIAILANKADVAEELDRLDTHVAEVSSQLSAQVPVGRRLDFLMQELTREANTLGSKSIVTSTTQRAVELKVLIEQMREQIQNIE